MGQLAEAGKRWQQSMQDLRQASTMLEKANAKQEAAEAFDAVLTAYVDHPRSAWDDEDAVVDNYFTRLDEGDGA